eukprot:2183221-Prymnesium_polylepis.1
MTLSPLAPVHCRSCATTEYLPPTSGPPTATSSLTCAGRARLATPGPSPAPRTPSGQSQRTS